MTDPNIFWQRTFPESEPGTDGLAVFEGRITDPELAGRPGWATTHGEMPSRRQAMARLIERWLELRALSRA